MLQMVMQETIYLLKTQRQKQHLGNLAKLKSKKDSESFKKSQEKEESLKLAEKIKNIKLQIKVKAGANGKVFGGVSTKEIAENLEKDFKIKVDKKKIDLKETIKTLGIRKVEIKLYEGVIAVLNVEVLAE